MCIFLKKYAAISDPAFDRGVEYSLKVIAMGNMRGVIIFEVSRNLILDPLVSGHKTSRS